MNLVGEHIDLRFDNPEAGKNEYMDYEEDDSDSYGCCGYILIILSIFLFILMMPILFIPLWFSFKIVKEYERAVVLRLGKIRRKNGKPIIYRSGVRFLLPCTDNFMRIDMRMKTMNVPDQDVLTSDSVTCRVNATICLRIIDPARALLKTEEPFNTAYEMGISALRDVIGQASLSTLLKERDEIDNKIEEQLSKITKPWGVHVEKVGIKDVVLPEDMRRAMAIEAEASRTARAKVIEAQGELNASKVLSDAAGELEKNPSSLHLRYLQTLNNIAAEQNSTVLFPIPMEMLKYFSKHSKDD